MLHKKLELRLLNTWKGAEQVDVKRETWPKPPRSLGFFLYKQATACNRDQESWPLVNAEDMSRFALDVLGTAMLGQSFGATEGKFDDTYRLCLAT